MQLPDHHDKEKEIELTNLNEKANFNLWEPSHGPHQVFVHFKVLRLSDINTFD